MHVIREEIKLPSRADAERLAPPKRAKVKQAGDPEQNRVRRSTEYLQSFLGSKDLDLLILKAHVLIEHELKRYIGFRLGLSDKEFARFEEREKNLGFHHVANIALAGDDHVQLLTAVSKLNDVRTEIAHRMDRESYEKKLNDFNDAIWGGPDKTPADIFLATTTSLSSVWAQVVRRYLDGRYGEGTFERVMP